MLAKKAAVLFLRGGDTPMHTMDLVGPLFQNLIKIFNNLRMFTMIRTLNQIVGL